MIIGTAGEDIRAGQHVHIGKNGLLHRASVTDDMLPEGMLHKPVFGRLEPVGKDGLYQVVDKPLEWTTTPPTVLGWFWAFFRNGKTPVIVQVYLSEQRGWEGDIRVSFRGTFYPLDEFSHWLGPLTVPNPPTE